MLAFGDSITNGGGELQWGVALQSWAQWVARGLGLPFTGYAFDGATAADVRGRQIPAHRRINARADARYELGCLYIGVNDVRAPGWDPRAYAADLRAALDYLAARCDRTLVPSIPLDLGRPRAGAALAEANAIIAAAAAEACALTLDLSRFGGRRHVMVDHVHPTALGQVEIAERALDVLAGAGLEAAVRPTGLIAYAVTPAERLRYEARYLRRLAGQAVAIRWRAAIARLSERPAARRAR